MTTPSGLLCLFKPRQWSSSDCVVKIRRILQRAALEDTKARPSDSKGGIRRKRLKVGHGGTLDPMAEGVLVLGVGEGTKVLSSYLKGFKSYRATGLLGQEMDTLDSTGVVTRTSSCDHVTIELLESKIPIFTGHIQQVPPMYSALNHQGKRLYALAREGITVERKPRDVEVKHLKLLRDLSPLPTFCLEMETSGGFYVRSLIHDMAQACGTHAHMTALLRQQQGPFSLEHCLHQSDWNLENILNHIEKCNQVVDYK